MPQGIVENHAQDSSVSIHDGRLIPEGSWPQYERTWPDKPLVCQLFYQEHCWVATFGFRPSDEGTGKQMTEYRRQDRKRPPASSREASRAGKTEVGLYLPSVF